MLLRTLPARARGSDWEQFWRLCQRERGALLGVLPGLGSARRNLGSAPGVWGPVRGLGLPGLGGSHWKPRAQGGLGRFEPVSWLCVHSVK